MLREMLWLCGARARRSVLGRETAKSLVIWLRSVRTLSRDVNAE